MMPPKEVVTRFFATFSTGDVPKILDQLTDDATWWVSGRVPGMSGTNDKDTLGKLLEAVKPLYVQGALTMTPTAMIAEGDCVACEAESHADLVDGRMYANQYHFLIEVSGTKVRGVREYSDKNHMVETFSAAT